MESPYFGVLSCRKLNIQQNVLLKLVNILSVFEVIMAINLPLKFSFEINNDITQMGNYRLPRWETIDYPDGKL